MVAEYEGKADSEMCASCNYFYSTGGLRGKCKKRPRLAQKHDDDTHATNWCQHYEADMDKKKLLEDAITMITPDPSAPITLTSEERDALNAEQEQFDKEWAASHPQTPPPSDREVISGFQSRRPYEDSEEVASDAYPHDWINDPTVAAHVVNENIRNELATMLKELAQFRTNTERQLIAVTLNGDNLAIMETKGMMRVAAIFYSQIEARMAQLTEAAHSYGAATSRPHCGDMQ